MLKEKIARTHNSTYKKLAVHWLNEVLCFVSSSVVAEIYQQNVKEALIKADRTMIMNEAVERAFGSNMKTITLDLPSTIETEEDYNKYWLDVLSDFYYKNMIAFIQPLTK